MKYVQYIRGNYVVRIVVPNELRPIVGLKELAINLGPDKKGSEKQAHGVIAGFLEQIEDAKEELQAVKPTLSRAAKEHYKSELIADDRARAAVGNEAVTRDRSLFSPAFANLLRLAIDEQIGDEQAEALVGWAADDLIAKDLTEPAVIGSRKRRELLKALAEVQLDAMARFEERDKGLVNFSEPKSQLLLMPDEANIDPPNESNIRSAGISLSELLGFFHKERTAGSRSLAKKTMEEHHTAVRMLNEFLQKNTSVHSITRDNLLKYKQALLECPTRYASRFPGLTITQAIKANSKRAEPYGTLDPGTINMKWLSHISTLFKWGVNNGYLNDNPANGVRVDIGKGFREPSRLPFDQEDLKALFGSKLFTENEFETKQWALLVALYTGARSQSEIARINISDIYQEQGIWVFRLAEASKNTQSKRLVPLHEDLITLGFLNYVEKLKDRAATRLFADWKPKDKINRWFLRVYRKQVGVDGKQKVFHSFRHTLKTALAHHGVNRDISDLITGHKDQSVAGIYISDASFTMIKAMSEAINRVKFDLPILQK